MNGRITHMSDNQNYPICRLLGMIKNAVGHEDRGMLAELRRGLSPSTQEYAWPHLVQFCGKFEDDDVRAIWCAVAGLAAIFYKSNLVSEQKWNNMGTMMHKLALQANESNPEKALESYGAKFRRVLSCNDMASLCETVIRVGRAAEKKDVTLNPEVLFWDLTNWMDLAKRDEVKLRWAKQYYSARNDIASDQEKEDENS